MIEPENNENRFNICNIKFVMTSALSLENMCLRCQVIKKVIFDVFCAAMVYIKTVKRTKSGACATHLVAPLFKISKIANLVNAPVIPQKIVVRSFH